MSISATDLSAMTAESVELSEESLTVRLSDGRQISVPLTWYPRLLHATAEERSHWRLIGHGRGIHWEDLDEDVSIENIILGKRSGESQRSLKRWLEARNVPPTSS